MTEQSSFEDVIRAVARRRVLVAVSIVALAVLGAWYGRRTTSGAEFSADATINIVDGNFIDAESVRPPSELLALVEASRLTTDLRKYAGDRFESVTVKADVPAKGIVITAKGSTATEAEELAVNTGTAFVTARRELDRTRFADQAVFEKQSLKELQTRLDKVNTDLANSTEQSLTLEGERIQLFDRLLKTNERAVAADTNAKQFDSGLTDPVIVEPATKGSSSGWIMFGMVGSFLGLMAGIGLVLMLNSLDHRVRSRADVEHIANGVPVLAVLGTGGADDRVYASLAARVAARRGAGPAAFIVGFDAQLPSGLTELLQSTGDTNVHNDIGSVVEPQAIVGVRAGATTDAELASVVVDLEARRVALVGVVLWGVPRSDLVWAGRPLLSAAI